LGQYFSEQGYHVGDPLIFPISEIEDKIESHSLRETFKNDQNQQLHLKFYLNSTVRESNIDEIIESTYAEHGNEDLLIIVLKDDPNDNLKETLNKKLMYEWETEKRLIILHNLHHLQFNRLRHELVPKHTILSDAEVETLRKRYNISDDAQFSDISRFDAVATCILIKPGQVCQIDRPSKTAITAPYYRRCINKLPF
jgi:DNA-directed RNA polymerase subunit H (RpoH/RPB5)